MDTMGDKKKKEKKEKKANKDKKNKPEKVRQFPIEKSIHKHILKKIRNTFNVVVVEYNISMHCYACERTVAKAISKIKGVEKFVTDMTRHKVIVTGKIDPQKVLKKLKKKTGKRVEIEPKKEDNSKDGDDGQPLLISMNQITLQMAKNCCGDCDLYTMFSDENANACSIM